jgi:hypothetical protein
MISCMVSIGAPDHALGRPKHSSNVVDGDAELQEHRGACVPKDMGRYIAAKTSKLASGTPSAYQGMVVL